MGAHALLRISAKAYDDIRARIEKLATEVDPSYREHLRPVHGGPPHIHMPDVAFERIPEEIDPTFEAKLKIFLHDYCRDRDLREAGAMRVEDIIRAWERLK